MADDVYAQWAADIPYKGNTRDSPVFNAEEEFDRLDSCSTGAPDSPKLPSSEISPTFHANLNLITSHFSRSKSAIAKHDLAYYNAINALNHLERIQSDIRSEHVQFCTDLERASVSMMDELVNHDEFQPFMKKTDQFTTSDMRAALEKLNGAIAIERKIISDAAESLHGKSDRFARRYGYSDVVYARVEKAIDRLLDDQSDGARPKTMRTLGARAKWSCSLVTAIKSRWASICEDTGNLTKAHWVSSAWDSAGVSAKPSKRYLHLAYHALFIACSSVAASQMYTWRMGGQITGYPFMGFFMVAVVLKLLAIGLVGSGRPVANSVVLLLLLAIEVNGWVWAGDW